MSPFPQATLNLMLLLACVGTGCNYQVYSPPARTLPLESPATVPVGTTGIAVEGGPGGALFGPDLAFGAARIRHAVNDQLRAPPTPPHHSSP